MVFQLSKVAEDFIRRAKNEFNLTEEQALSYIFKHRKNIQTVEGMLEVIRKDLAGEHEDEL